MTEQSMSSLVIAMLNSKKKAALGQIQNTYIVVTNTLHYYGYQIMEKHFSFASCVCAAFSQ